MTMRSIAPPWSTSRSAWTGTGIRSAAIGTGATTRITTWITIGLRSGRVILTTYIYNFLFRLLRTYGVMNKIVTKTIRFIFVMYLRVVLNTRYIVYYSIWDVKNAVDNIDIF